MSPGDDHDYRGKDQGVRTDDPYSTLGGTRQTRTRLPDSDTGTPHPRRPARNSRSLVTVVGIVVLLIAAIAFANRGGGNDDEATGDSRKPGTKGATSTAATGTKPVTGTDSAAGTIASGFAHDEQGAQSAAANYAVALGSAEMFDTEARRGIIQATHVPAVVSGLQAELDRAYSPDFYRNVGLNADGTTPAGLAFVSRTVPVGTKLVARSGDTATVEVWCTGLVGMAGQGSTKPVTETWVTISQKLKWVGGDWKIESSSQAEGPTPVNSGDRASTADEIAGAVEGYGGFTYAR
ncbi:hypothetical protein [Streptomyces sp. BE147]|uniref:hypothetical protein n=1 Tax=unclassified Streptomyces TaxID=2593676 RepID=UPI002E7734FC|nr:hypothetical protein [Streptomyces sp. BE147]MEE1737328.1 hypothetical protein [Streptomyces sp. BE147]